MERKEFFRQLVIRGGAAIIIPAAILQACEKDDTTGNPPDNPGNGNNDLIIDLTDPDYAPLQEVGGYVFVSSEDLIIIRTGEEAYTVLTTVCTHQGCTVGFDSNTNTLPCPCHGSLYDINGNVLNGPAPAPLAKYNATIDGSDLVIAL